MVTLHRSGQYDFPGEDERGRVVCESIGVNLTGTLGYAAAGPRRLE